MPRSPVTNTLDRQHHFSALQKAAKRRVDPNHENLYMLCSFLVFKKSSQNHKHLKFVGCFYQMICSMAQECYKKRLHLLDSYRSHNKQKYCSISIIFSPFLTSLFRKISKLSIVMSLLQQN